MITRQDKRKRAPLSITLAAQVHDDLQAYCRTVGAATDSGEPIPADVEYVVEQILIAKLAEDRGGVQAATTGEPQRRGRKPAVKKAVAA